MIFSILFLKITDSKADDRPKDGIYSTATGRCWGNGTDCKKNVAI